MIRTFDGGYIFCGFTYSNDDDVSGNHNLGQLLTTDAWVVKLDFTGAIEWQKCFGGTADDGANSIIQMSDGGYAVAGWTTSEDGDVKGKHGGVDTWVLKLDSLGNLLWQKCLGGSGYEEATSIVESPGEGGGLVVVGYTRSTDGDVAGKHLGTRDSAYDVWVVKLSSYNGAIEWQKCFGGSADDRANCIINTSDHGYAICGFTYSRDGDVSGFHSGKYITSDAWVIKLTSTGTLQWQKCMGGTNYDWANALIQTPDGGYAVIGGTSSRDGDVYGVHFSDSTDIGDDAWLVKLSPLGKIERQKCLGGTSGEGGLAILQISNGDFIVGASTTSGDGDVTFRHEGSEVWIVKLDSSLNIIWEKCFGGRNNDDLNSILQSSDGQLIFSASTSSFDGDVIGWHGTYPPYPSDAWVVQLDASLGVEAWHSDFRTDNSFKIYPNPSSMQIKFDLYPTIFLKKAEFYDIMGRQQFPIYTTLDHSASVDVHNLLPGTYIARLTWIQHLSWLTNDYQGNFALPFIVKH